MTIWLLLLVASWKYDFEEVVELIKNVYGCKLEYRLRRLHLFIRKTIVLRYVKCAMNFALNK